MSISVKTAVLLNNITFRLSVFENFQKSLNFGCHKVFKLGIFKKSTQFINTYNITPNRYLTNMSSSDKVEIENKEVSSELQPEEQSNLNTGENLELSESVVESTQSFPPLVKKESVNNILEDSKVCSVSDFKVNVELVESDNFHKTVGTQCSGSSEDCIIVLKYVWSEGEDEDEQSDMKVGENEEDNIQIPQSEEKWHEIVNEFSLNWNFSNYIGGIVGNSVQIVAP